MQNKRIDLEASKLIPANPIGEYGELHKPRRFDNGDRSSYGYGVGFRTIQVMVDGKLVSLKIPTGKPSKHKGAKQTIS